MLGHMDTIFLPFTDKIHQGIQNGYMQLVENLKNLPTKPEIFLLEQPGVKRSKDNGVWPFAEYRLVNMLPNMIQETAKKFNIPDDHVIDLSELIPN